MSYYSETLFILLKMDPFGSIFSMRLQGFEARYILKNVERRAFLAHRHLKKCNHTAKCDHLFASTSTLLALQGWPFPSFALFNTVAVKCTIFQVSDSSPRNDNLI